ncbi:NAD(P)H-dependent flavin oxidoreductase [Anaeromicropila populeti]|uniref:Probable nitronate monooxygenase n=1 Tax=Anaeromicropila populeti TaxID=37658 RepID=A0A1I6HUV6_9FIRM|nr:nitronate monooxygenase family protein [Anaeromicropila populeti]SFR58000.1 NAD(P)H-dependent flavin oxidoreductase YrpB, nitropropane dioxygenase family [Anaeromicropila populeti]
MILEPLVIGDLKVRIPIIQGGMGVGVSRYRLAGTVAKEGGIGIISTAQIGYDEPEFESEPIETNLSAIKKHLRMAKEIAEGGVVGVNIMVATQQYKRYVEAAVEGGADVIISGAGLPVELPAYVKGTNTKIAPIVSSVRAANVILSLWDKKYKRTADFIVIEGPKAGGHLGFTVEQLANIEQTNYDEEIVNIIKAVSVFEEKYQVSIPVIVAGGVFTHEDIVHCMELGAKGVQIATRFVVTEECDASDAYKQAYINAKKEDIVIVMSPVGMPGRAIKNTFLERIKKEREPITKCFNCIVPCKPKETPYCITKALTNAVVGDLDNGLIFCGEDVYRLNKMTTVHELMDELAAPNGMIFSQRFINRKVLEGMV